MMQIKDYIALVALAVSMLSLIVAFHNTGFSRRIKLAELRVTILAKISEASLSNSRLKRINADFAYLVGHHKDVDLLGLLDVPDIEENQRDIDALYQRVAKSDVKRVASIYESIFHDINQICGRIDMLEKRLLASKSQYENLRGKPSV